MPWRGCGSRAMSGGGCGCRTPRCSRRSRIVPDDAQRIAVPEPSVVTVGVLDVLQRGDVDLVIVAPPGRIYVDFLTAAGLGILALGRGQLPVGAHRTVELIERAILDAAGSAGIVLELRWTGDRIVVAVGLGNFSGELILITLDLRELHELVSAAKAEDDRECHDRQAADGGRSTPTHRFPSVRLSHQRMVQRTSPIAVWAFLLEGGSTPTRRERS